MKRLVLFAILIFMLLFTCFFINPTRSLISVTFPEVVIDNRYVGIGMFLQGQELTANVNVTFDEPLPLGENKTNITVEILNPDGTLFAQKTIPFKPLLEEQGILSDGKYTYKPYFFDFNVTLTGENVTYAPVKFNYSMKRELYNLITPTGSIPSPPDTSIGRGDLKWNISFYCGGRKDQWDIWKKCGCNEIGFRPGGEKGSYEKAGKKFYYDPPKTVDADEVFDYKISSSETADRERAYRLDTWVYVNEPKTINFDMEIVEQGGMKLFLESDHDGHSYCKTEECGGSRICNDHITYPGDNAGQINLPGKKWSNLVLYIYSKKNKDGEYRLTPRKSIDHFYNLFDCMNSGGPLEGCGRRLGVENPLWKAEKARVVRSITESAIKNYCSGPWDFEGDTEYGAAREAHNCNGDKVNIKVSRTNRSSEDKPELFSAGITYHGPCEDQYSYHFSTWVATRSEKKIDFEIAVNDGMSIYLDDEKKITCGCSGEEGCGDTPRVCEERLIIPVGVHKLDVYVYNNKDRCTLDANVISPDWDFFYEAFDAMNSDTPSTGYEYLSYNATVSPNEGLMEVAGPLRYLETGKYKEIRATEHEKVDFGPRMACGNQEYGECKEHGGGTCKTDMYGWILSRRLDRETTNYEVGKWCGSEGVDDVRFFIEPFEHGSLYSKRNRYRPDGEEIGGVYRCRGAYREGCDYNYANFCCTYQSPSEVQWNGKDGNVTICDFDQSAYYIINYLPYDGGGGDIRDFTQFKELPKFCAYTSFTPTANIVSYTSEYNNSECDRESEADCCVCKSGFAKCKLDCKNERGLRGNRFTMPLEFANPLGGEWEIKNVSLTINSTADPYINFTYEGDPRHGWDISAELLKSASFTLYKNYTAQVNFFDDFGFYAPNKTGTYTIEAILEYEDKSGDIKKIQSSSSFEVVECKHPGDTRPYYNKSKYPGTVGVGACKEGIQTCGEDYKWYYNESNDEPTYPSNEICNGIDDDCNGIVDDIGGMENIIDEFINLVGGGVVKTAREITKCGCFEGAPATREVCNGIDDDCDGTIDNEAKTLIINTCTPFVEACERTASWMWCNNIYLTADCDLIEKTIRMPTNLTVNTCTDKVKKCMENKHIRKVTKCVRVDRSGVHSVSFRRRDEECFETFERIPFTYDECKWIYSQPGCFLEQKEVIVLNDTCACSGGGEPSEEVCNGIDDDCNSMPGYSGIDDVEFGQTCACHFGTNISLIHEYKQGIDNTCNGIDDDCDGIIDEDAKECACTRRSSSETLNITTYVQEICDGVDNDCDGLVDENFAGLGKPCGKGNCFGGGWVCNVYGDGLVCNTSVNPDETFLGNAFNYVREEECDLNDNDCDGSIDEECACTPSDIGIAKICGYESGLYYRDQAHIGMLCDRVMKNITSLLSWATIPEGITYRRSFTLENKESTSLVNYPVEITLNTMDLIQENKMRDDGGDLRIVERLDGVSGYIDWIHSDTFSSEETKIWFRANIPGNNESSYYLYYGDLKATYPNPSVTFVKGLIPERNTLLLCHFDNSTVCEGNVIPKHEKGISFEDGYYDQGISLESDSLLSYPTSKNFNKERGSLGMWVKPKVSYPSSGVDYPLFHVNDSEGEDQFKLHAFEGNLIFDLFDKNGVKHSISADVSSWNANEFHYVAITWDRLNGMELYVDGERKANLPGNWEMGSVGVDLYIGSGGSSANAVIDEFVIYSQKVSGDKVKMDMRLFKPEVTFGREETLKEIISGEVAGESPEEVFARCDQFLRNITETIPDPEKRETILSLCDSIKICNKSFSVDPLGECTLGMQECVGGEWGVCTANFPRTEICDGKDNDCNGVIDDVAVPETCACYEGNEPSEEVCNGIDDDCNGIIDDVKGGNSNVTTHCGCFDRIVNITQIKMQPELSKCNGIDDNCNGIIDEGVSNCVCSGTVFNPTEDNITNFLSQDEVCNGIDDNCNSEIDENYKKLIVNGVNISLGAPCGPVNSRCFGGEYVCSKDGTQTVCSTMSNDGVRSADLSQPEICNGIDDDCDGTIDDVFGEDSGDYCQCYNGNSERNQWDEICDGKDNDCNGFIDDGLTDCGCSIPTIFNQTNAYDIASEIESKKLSMEICNNIDDNCNVMIDDVLGGQSVCFCYGGFGGNPITRPEFCNGVDDDCNGIIDDTNSPEACACYEGNEPSEEVCNGIDDDCDGMVDENWEDLGSACGYGVCSGGKYECSEDGTDVICSTIGGSEDKQSMEKCDNIDNDCDYTIDEGCECSPGQNKTCGLETGECRTGNQICLGDAGWSECTGAIYPKKEVCNGKDDDCNGIIDDVKGGTSKETTRCGCYGGSSPGTEICNGIDDDCDGTIDNVNNGNSLETTRCGCFNKNYAPGAGIEICNGIDDDCNGIIDDVKGENSATSTKCGCFGGGEPANELCDGIDNDCDGLIDENFPDLGKTCGFGVCTGIYVCSLDGLSLVCNGAEPTPEVCDSKDNDCDGKIDEGCFGGFLTSCENGIQDGDEEGIDCGGSCETPCVLISRPSNTWIYVFVVIVVVIIIIGVALALWK
jgi:hypothetical protein